MSVPLEEIHEEKAVDLRVRRTRLLIEKAFLELLMQQGFEEITVNAIAERAMVNRGTFYDHFTDKYDLFHQIAERQFREQLHRNLVGNDDDNSALLESLILTVCQFMAGLNDQCRPAAARQLPPIDDFITGMLASSLSPLKRKDARGTCAGPAGEMASWAIYGAARYWSKQTNREPVRTYARSVTPRVLALIEA